MKAYLLCLFGFLAFPLPSVAAAADEAPELFSRVARYISAYVINADGSYTETREMAYVILKEQALKSAKQSSVSYSTSIQTAEVLDAYTQKADGRRIDSPKSNFQVESNSGKGKDAPVFSDLTTLTVVFPDVEVGDTVVFSYRLTASEPMFPRQFSVHEYFPRAVAYDAVRVSVDAPASLWIQHQARAMREESNVEEGDRRRIAWTYANAQPPKSRRYDYSAFDVEQEPGVAISTFHSHAEIAQAYGARATPKAAVSERLRLLADAIAKNAKTPRDTAKVLYDWVALNITYAGHCIGLGAVVPHDTEFILDNRMGDCKDHATLLQALLAAKGIASTQALVNAGTAYRLPRVPVVAMVNHVINYLPAFDLYLDSTSQWTPFGLLPDSDIGKPVLLVDGHQEGLRTPSPPVGSNQERMQASMTLSPDGSVRAEVVVQTKGQLAAIARARMRHLKKDVLDDWVKNLYKSKGYIAEGRIDRDDPSALLDSYRYAAKFTVKNLIAYPGTGAFSIEPPFSSELPIRAIIAEALQHDEEASEFACSSGMSVEEYTFVLPKGMKVLAIPDNMKVRNSFLSYEASYRLVGKVLTVRRALDDRTPNVLCSARVAEEYRAFAKKVLPNIKAQVIYK